MICAFERLSHRLHRTVPPVEGYAATVTDDEALTMRLTVIGG
jgi:hypothetical protein